MEPFDGPGMVVTSNHNPTILRLVTNTILDILKSLKIISIFNVPGNQFRWTDFMPEFTKFGLLILSERWISGNSGDDTGVCIPQDKITIVDITHIHMHLNLAIIFIILF